MLYANTIGSIAIGSFDGIHRAHQVLISHAEGVVVIERGSGYLTPGFRRSLYIDKPLWFYLFDQIRNLEPKAFVDLLQEHFPLLKRIVVGYDFVFGKEKKGNTHTLQALFSGEVYVVDEICHHGISVHSRTIREYLLCGDIRQANELLGRAYEVEGKVVKGQGLGGRKLVATLNLSTQGYQLPKEGVYITKTKFDRLVFPSVSFVGKRGTDNKFAFETHCIGVKDLDTPYGAEVVFFDRIRDAKHFNDLVSLRKQIEHDIEVAEAWHAKR